MEAAIAKGPVRKSLSCTNQAHAFAAFVNPGTPLREELTRPAAKPAAAITHLGKEFTPIGRLVEDVHRVCEQAGKCRSHKERNRDNDN
jgi:hypothetical protein